MRSDGEIEDVSDATAIADAQVALVGKRESDTLEIADSGVLISQDYVDNNLYFADDYVGEKRTFKGMNYD